MSTVEFKWPDRWQSAPYGWKDVRLQAFVDNACTQWLDVEDLMTGTDEQIGQKLRKAISRQVAIANENS